MVSNYERESMRFYAFVWNSNALVWNSNDMLWDFNSMLCYGVCFKRYAWTDCTYIDYANNIEISVLNHR